MKQKENNMTFMVMKDQEKHQAKPIHTQGQMTFLKVFSVNSDFKVLLINRFLEGDMEQKHFQEEIMETWDQTIKTF